MKSMYRHSKISSILVFCLAIFASGTDCSAAGAVDLDSLLIKSVGGQPAYKTLRHFSTFHSSGKAFVNGTEGTFEQYFMAPDKYYQSIQLPGFGMIQGFDGTTAWQRDLNGRYTVMQGQERQEILQAVDFESYNYLFPDRRTGQIEFLGEKTLDDGVTYYEVAIIPFDNDTTFAYLDTATGRQTYMSNRSDQITTTIHGSDYRKIQSVLIPFDSKATTSQADFTLELIADTASFNGLVDSTIFQMPNTAVTDFHFPADKSQVTIKFDYRFGHIRVPAVINAKKKVWMILDSGASSNLFHTPAVESLHLPEVGTLPAMGVSGYDQVSLVRTDSIQIGALTLYNQVAGSLNLGSVARMFNENDEFGGLLGYDFLSRFPILINYQDSTLTVFNPETFEPPEGGVVVPFYLTMQVPTVEGELNGYKGDFIIDLGNAFGLILHRSYVDKYDLEHKLSDIQSASNLLGGVGGQVSGKSAFAATFKIGDILIQSLRVLLPDSSEGVSGSNVLAGNIGNLVLQNFSLLFDYPDSQLIFYKPAEEQETEH